MDSSIIIGKKSGGEDVDIAQPPRYLWGINYGIAVPN